ncbi:palmitoyltransferase ZDHHC18 isoform X2 [Euwallacea fornicatus]|uniref:palmitoyltransferase ZDHHC18 isoform X2 n=1 Tax=Euwallacea fornicatus TaxID=995702 RepID=UPI00338E4DE1
MTMARERITRKWEIFQGRNKFYCSGRFMTAPNAGVFLLTVFLITVTSSLFFIFDCKYLAENVTIAIPVIGAILFIFTMSSLLRTSLTDPGIIPRATSEEAAYVEKQIEVTNSANSPTYRPPPRTKEVLVKGQTVKLKYCFTCKLFRPPRASHCSICDNCVERFDHHCPWVGNCVGRRNYRFFYMFIISLAFLAVFIFACAVAHLILITKEGKFFEAVKDSPASAIVAVICFFSVWSVLGLAGFHTYLTTSNQTTNEDIKGSFTSKRGQDSFNPYSEGNVCVNCFHILCGPVTPSLIDRRGVVTDSYRSEISQPIIFDSPLAAANYSLKIQNGTSNSADLPGGIYRQTTETTGSVSLLVSNEHPIAVAPALQRLPEDSMNHYKSHPSLSNSPVYNNIVPLNHTLSKSRSYAENINSVLDSKSDPIREQKVNLAEDLCLDPVVLREKHLISNGTSDRTKVKYGELKLDNDLTVSEKENNLMSASRLRLLQDTTMIESALDLDSLEESSVGTNSQAGLMKVMV